MERPTKVKVGDQEFAIRYATLYQMACEGAKDKDCSKRMRDGLGPPRGMIDPTSKEIFILTEGQPIWERKITLIHEILHAAGLAEEGVQEYYVDQMSKHLYVVLTENPKVQKWLFSTENVA